MDRDRSNLHPTLSELDSAIYKQGQEISVTTLRMVYGAASIATSRAAWGVRHFVSDYILLGRAEFCETYNMGSEDYISLVFTELLDLYLKSQNIAEKEATPEPLSPGELLEFN